MAEIKDKVVTVESLAALHENNKDTYMTKENPVGNGTFSINRKADTTIGDCSVATGRDTTASGICASAEGIRTTALGNCTHVEGRETIASSTDQHVQGRYNVEDSLNEYAHIVGNGASDTKRSNAHTLDWKGNAWFAGNVSMNGNIVLGSHQYGDTLPTAGIVGRIFFKKLSE